MNTDIFSNLVILIILTNILAEQINNKTLSVEELNKISNNTQEDFNAGIKNTAVNSHGMDNSTAPDQGLFIINIPFNPCLKNQIQDRRGKCRKIARVQ